MYDRYYSSLDIWAISFGCMIGWGVFVMPGTTFLPVAGPIGTLIAMSISVVIILVIAANYVYLMRERSSTDSGIQGTGLGLAIVKNLTDIMEGTIDVTTAPGEGTEFIVRLTFEQTTEEAVASGETNDAEAKDQIDFDEDFADKRLLVVEDNEINREIVTMLLKEAGFILESAENGQIAIDMLVEGGPHYYDAILMDIQMPVMDGYTATRNIRALENKDLASVPIIALTANAFSEDETAAKRAGMQAHISKPIEVDVLMRTLAEILTGAES